MSLDFIVLHQASGLHSLNFLQIVVQRQSLERFKGAFTSPWDEVTIALIQVITNSMDENYKEAYKEQAALVKLSFSATSLWRPQGARLFGLKSIC